MAGRQDPCAVPHAALWHRRVRGIRAYETANGPAVFRLTDHIQRLYNSAKILQHGDAVLGARDRGGLQARSARQRAAVVLPAPDRLLRLWRDGPGHDPLHGRCRHRHMALGRLPGRRSPHLGRAHEDLVVGPATTQHHAAGLQDHRQLRQLNAGQDGGPAGGVRRGDHAQRRRTGVGVHRREHLRRLPGGAGDAAAIFGRAARHHPALGDRNRPRPGHRRDDR